MEQPGALVIEDAADVRRMLSEVLRMAGFEVSEAATGAQGLDLVEEMHPDLVTLDLMLPDMDGIEVCRRLRSMTSAYVIMVTGRVEETDRLVGLEVGADDYVTKPFSPRELRARVAAMFRRPRTVDAPGAGAPPENAGAPTENSVITFGDLVIDEEGREVRLAGRPVELTRIEFDLLVLLASNPRRVWSRETLTRRVWHTDWPGNDHVIDVHIANLRRKLGDDARAGRWVRTVHGVGYRFGG
ncbi:response regulator transcription factor [Nonomuraea lactucae]|uniref:response regulator transcription factor n=1 Tax=Nonomuraea lactucae TaxID=2249762 RepID=UPI000DE457C2|nr:response regulator transcription factor [Nonomuraea lactucae]